MMIHLNFRYKTAVLFLFLVGIATGVLGQVVRPETVFQRERIASGSISMARITTTGRLTGTQVEVYHFNQDGRLIAVITQGERASDTLFGRTYDRERATHQQEIRREGMRKEVLNYDEDGRLVKKVILVDDATVSEVLLSYDSAGLLLLSAEINTDGDTIRTASYSYDGGILVSIDYTGAPLGKIEYFRQGRYNVSRVFSPAGELLMTRTERYGRNRSLKRETLSVPGVGITPPTVYRYRFRLLRTILHPDGSKSRVKYLRDNS